MLSHARARSPFYLPPSFRPSAKLVPPTMPSADFCVAIRSPYDDLSPESGTQHRSPEVRPTAFTARPPDLPPRPLMTMDFAISCSLIQPGRPRYPVLVHRAVALLHASFRPHLAVTPLRFANPSPSSGWIEDFHLQAVDHARHTTRNRRAGARRLATEQRSHGVWGETGDGATGCSATTRCRLRNLRCSATNARTYRSSPCSRCMRQKAKWSWWWGPIGRDSSRKRCFWPSSRL